MENKELQESIVKLLRKVNTITNSDSFIGCYLDMSFKIDFKNEYLYISLSNEDLTYVNSFNYCTDDFIDVSMIDLQDLENYDYEILDTTFEILELTKNKLKGDN